MPRVIKPLTETQISKTKPHPTKTKNLFDGNGLYLLIKPSGAKHWRMLYQAPDGRRRTLSFGAWPRITLEEARNRRVEAISIIKAGGDPAEEKKIPPESIKKTPGHFAQAAERWLSTQRPNWTKVHDSDFTRKLELHILPIIGGLPIEKVDRAAIQAVLDPLASAGKYQTLKKIKGIISAIIQFAPPELGIIDWTKQIGRLQYPAKAVKNRACLKKPAEIAGLMRAIESYRSSSLVTALAMKFSALTFVRPGEVRHAEWVEIDESERLWRIPSDKMKAKRPHLVPLSKHTLAVLEELQPITGRNKYIFPGRAKNEAMSEATVLAALRRLGYSKDDMSAHGFKGMASTVLNEKGWNRDWIERQLAHIEGNKVRAAYNHTDFLDGRRRMMDWWGTYLEALETDTTPPPVAYLP